MTILSEGERNSAVWQKLRQHYEEQLAKLRVRNDGEMTEFKRAKLCGHIEAVKSILSLGTETPVLDDDSAPFPD